MWFWLWLSLSFIWPGEDGGANEGMPVSDADDEGRIAGERFGAHSGQTHPCSREAPIPYLHKEKKRFWVELYLLFFFGRSGFASYMSFFGGWVFNMI